MNTRVRRSTLHAPRSQRGSILIVVLWVVLILSMMVSTFAFSMHIETRLVSYHERELKAKALAIAGIEYEKALLSADILTQGSDMNAQTAARRSGATANTAQSSTKGADYYTEPWHNNPDLTDHPLGDGTFTVQIVDEQSKLNANVITPEQWRLLLTNCGVDSQTTTLIAESVSDWIDKDDAPKLNGVEDDYYMGLPPEQGGPYHCKNGPMDRIEELLLVRGMTPDFFYGHDAQQPSDVSVLGVGQFLTTLPFTKINVNTASSQVLQCIPGVTADMADQLVRYRQGDDGVDGTTDDKPFEEVGEIWTVWGGTVSRNTARLMTRYLDVKSSFFTIRSTGTVGNVRKTILTTVFRGEDGSVNVITWNEQAR